MIIKEAHVESLGRLIKMETSMKAMSPPTERRTAGEFSMVPKMKSKSAGIRMATEMAMSSHLMPMIFP